MNEDELVANVLLPWLAAVGFEAPEVELEHSFSVRFGRERKTTARSDVLLKRGSISLMVIEAKAPDVKLTTDDEEQAVSYARLVTPIAPVAVVTNGRESRIIDTRTGEKLDVAAVNAGNTSFWCTERFAPSPHDIDLQLRALMRLIALSPENAKAFCEQQIARATKIATGVVDLRWPHIDFDLHIPRSRITAGVSEFIAGRDTFFVLTGDAGSGKTSEMVRLATELARDHLALFIPVRVAGGAPLDYLAEEFNWSFSQERSPDRLLKDLIELAAQSGRHIVLMLDAPEGVVPAFRSQLSILVNKAGTSGGKLKVIMACEPATWRQLAVDRTALTSIGITGRSEKSSPLVADIEMPPLRGLELERAFRVGAQRYNVKGDLHATMHGLCSSPAILRMILIRCAGDWALATPDEQTLARNFVSWSAANSGEQELCRDGLRALCKALVEEQPSPGDGVSENVFLENSSRSALDALSAAGLIVTRKDDHDRMTLSFREPWVERYCIAFLWLAIDRMKLSEIGDQAPVWRQNRVLAEAIGWYASVTDVAVQKALYRDIEAAAERYADALTRIRKIAPALWRGGPTASLVLVPLTDVNDLGYVVYWPVAAAPKVTWAETDRRVAPEWRSLVATRDARDEGGEFLVFAPGLFEGEEQTAQAAVDAKERLREFLNHEAPKFESSLVLAEIVWGIVLKYHRDLDLDVRSSTIAMEDLKRGIELLHARRYFEERVHDQLREKQNGRGPTTIGPVERDEILRNARSAVADNKRLRPRSRLVGSTLPIQTLIDSSERLERLGVTNVQQPIILPMDLIFRSKLPESHTEREKLATALCELFLAAMNECRALLHSMFSISALAALAPFVDRPLRVEVDLFPARDPGDSIEVGCLFWSAEVDSVDVAFVAGEANSRYHKNFMRKVERRSRDPHVAHDHVGELSRLVVPPPMPLEKQVDSRSCEREMPIRALTLNLLNEVMMPAALRRLDNLISIAASASSP